ncbi:MAG: oligosaccharide flippase family protein [Caldilineaceae bacterium]|nr:oligosaccharide flippase family protein [Caldilineaceae bacterium]
MPETEGAESSKTIARLAVRGGVWVMIGVYGNQFIGFVAMLVLTRQLSQEVFGTFALAAFWAGLLNIRTKLGLNYAAVRRGELDGRLLGTYFVLDVISGVLSLLLTALVIWWLTPQGDEGAATSGFDQQVAIALAVMMLTEFIPIFAGPANVIIERKMHLSAATLWSFASYLTAYICALILAFATQSLWSLLIINGVAFGIGVIGSRTIVRRDFPEAFRWRWRFDRTLAVGLLRDGIATGMAMALLGVITAQFDNFLVGTYVSRAELGYYDRAFRLAAWPNVLLTVAIARIAFLTMAKVKEDPERLAHTVRMSFWIITTFGVPLALTLSFAASDVVTVLYGERWMPSALFLRLLALASIGTAFLSIAFWLAAALGRHRVTIGLAVSQALLLVTVGTILTLTRGALGTAFAVCINAFLGATIGCIYTFRETKLSPREVLLFPLLATGIAVGAFYAVANLPQWTTMGDSLPEAIARIVATALMMGVVYLGVLLTFNRREMLVRIAFLRASWR